MSKSASTAEMDVNPRRNDVPWIICGVIFTAGQRARGRMRYKDAAGRWMSLIARGRVNAERHKTRK